MKAAKQTLFLSFTSVLICVLSISCSPKKQYDIIIEDVKFFDGFKSFEHATIYIQNGLVANIDTTASPIDGNYKELIQGNNKTLIPGLINAHAHPQNRNDLSVSAKAGILTVMEMLRIVEDSIPVFKSLGEQSSYANYYSAGIGADMPNAVIQFFVQKPNPWAIHTKKEVSEFLAERKKSKVDFIKIFQDSRLPEKFSDSIFDELILETHKNKLLAVCHSEVLRDARFEFHHQADIIAHGWVDSMITTEELNKWKQRDFYVIPTLLLHVKVKNSTNPKSYTLTEEQMIAEIGRLHKAGITILAGTDAPNDNLNFSTDFYNELALYQKAGIPPIEVLKTATSNPAKAFKIGDIGLIKEGMLANLVLVNGDVLSNIQNLHQTAAVWKNGKRIK